MPPLRPIKRSELIKYLKKFKFDGPYSGGKHQFMIRDQLRITIPNQHQSDIGTDFLIKILKQADISKESWLDLK